MKGFASTRSSSRRRVLAAVAVAALTVAACSSDGDEEESADAGSSTSTVVEASPELQAIIDAANEEGSLELASAASFGQTDAGEALVDAFQDYYPGLDIDVRSTPGASQGETANRVREEVAAGQPSHTDVLGVTAGAIGSLMADDVLRADIPWDDLPDVRPEMVDSVYGSTVEVQRFIQVVVYNTDAVGEDEVPETTADLLDPQFTGRLATTPFVGGFDILLQEWGLDRTKQYVTAFAAQLGGQTGGGSDVNPLVTGQFDMIAFLPGPGAVEVLKADGAPVDYTILSDAAMTYQLLLTVPTTAAHPNAAELWINFVASPSGQDVLREHAYMDTPLVPGSLTGEQIADAEAEGAEFVNADVAWYAALDQEEYSRNAQEIIDIVRNGTGG
jgi:ABC-type Fe3+ transport system substrate-binding protein